MKIHDEVREFWFGVALDDGEVAERQSSLWWSKDPAADAEIRRMSWEIAHSGARVCAAGWRTRLRRRFCSSTTATAAAAAR